MLKLRGIYQNDHFILWEKNLKTALQNITLMRAMLSVYNGQNFMRSEYINQSFVFKGKLSLILRFTLVGFYPLSIHWFIRVLPLKIPFMNWLFQIWCHIVYDALSIKLMTYWSCDQAGNYKTFTYATFIWPHVNYNSLPKFIWNFVNSELFFINNG